MVCSIVLMQLNCLQEGQEIFIGNKNDKRGIHLYIMYVDKYIGGAVTSIF